MTTPLEPTKPVYLPTQRVVLVTGATHGLGREIAHGIGRTGARVLIGACDVQSGECTAAAMREEGIYANFIHVDVERPDTVAAAACLIEQNFGRLDVLVNNAGITDQGDGPPSRASVPAVRRIFDTNFFGALSTTQGMLPLLRKSRAARIVNISTSPGSLGHDGSRDRDFAEFKRFGYSASKAALSMLSEQLACELKGSRVKVNSLDTGCMASDQNGRRAHQGAPHGAAAVIHLALLEEDGPSDAFHNTAQLETW